MNYDDFQTALILVGQIEGAALGIQDNGVADLILNVAEELAKILQKDAKRFCGAGCLE